MVKILIRHDENTDMDDKKWWKYWYGWQEKVEILIKNCENTDIADRKWWK